MATEDEDECEFCGGAHESRDCDLSFCATCREGVDNCECEPCVEVTAEEFLALLPKARGK